MLILNDSFFLIFSHAVANPFVLKAEWPKLL